MIPTRRQFLQSAAAMSVGTATSSRLIGPRIFAGSDCLSQESAAGFRSVLGRWRAVDLIVLCARCEPDPLLAGRLLRDASRGAWLLWECMPSDAITTGPAIDASDHRLFIRYRWPHATLTRRFSRVVPVDCADSEAIAHYRGVPVAMKRRIGRGGIVFLGSMLGPNLCAGESEARRLASAIFSEIASADTTTAASTNT